MKNNMVFIENPSVKITDIDNVMTCRSTYKECNLSARFITESEKTACTTMQFASGTGGKVKEKAVAQNYDYFVHTMAEMIKKYAPEITE